jgi:phage gp37-like protein
MSAASLDAVIAYLREKFTKAEVITVKPYAGEFGVADMTGTAYAAPAIFVTELGSQPAEGGTRTSGVHVRRTRMAAFVVYKHANRDTRMRGAMLLAEKLTMLLRLWRPDSTGLAYTLSPLERGANCENLFDHARDALGQAVWLVDWAQDVEPQTPAMQLLDWLGTDIASTAGSATPQDEPPTDELITTTHGVTMRT